ncbi:hypothetical protein VNO78_06821 [Psophocarpus tetragonolobus]|uniref:Uncharacterized protein n=1 Tax=Psophocarpus tetragonolobus TaxID=3891 RepID=A0AAN9T227_PSOTE
MLEISTLSFPYSKLSLQGRLIHCFLSLTHFSIRVSFFFIILWGFHELGCLLLSFGSYKVESFCLVLLHCLKIHLGLFRFSLIYLFSAETGGKDCFFEKKGAVSEEGNLSIRCSQL